MSDNETRVANITPAIGKKIVGMGVVNRHTLQIDLAGGARIEIWDDAQYCCERRWMHTDDDLALFVGSTFVGATIRGAGWADGYEAEVAFMIVSTSIGQFTVVNYNDHNGYYGGFNVRATYTPGDSKNCLFM